MSPSQLAAKVRFSIGFRLSRYISEVRRKRFQQVPPSQYRRDYSNERLPGVHVYSLCGQRDYYQQILCILSFLRHTGIPETWTVASDGSLTEAMSGTLKQLHRVICIVPWTSFINEQNRAAVEWYSKSNPMGKKLAIVTGLSGRPTSVYIDSDILFFPGAVHLREILRAHRHNFAMRDWAQNFPQGLATAAEAQVTSLNAGFLIQSEPIAWDEPLGRLARLLREHPERDKELRSNWLIEQTLVHIAYHASGTHILDDKLYVLEGNDAQHLHDPYDHPDRVLRHYLGYSRKKLWNEAIDYYT